MNREKILIIGSCGKKKALFHPSQPNWNQLNSKAKRNKILSNWKGDMMASADLYLGPQPMAIKKAVELLRKQFEVDYYIISAGFGLVKDDDLLPPYDSTFSDKKVSDIQAMSDRLGIDQDIDALDENYDLIYLALGKDYLRSISDLTVFQAKANQVVLPLSKPKHKEPPFYPIDLAPLIGNDKIPGIRYRIGSFTESKGSLLVNYAYYLNKIDQYQPFSTFWEIVKSELKSTTIIPKVSVKSKISKNRIQIGNTTYMPRGQDYLVTQSAKQEIANIVKNYDNTFLRELASSCKGLTPFNYKKWGHHSKYHANFKNSVPIYRKLHKQVDSMIEQLKDENNTIGKLRIEYISQLKAKQISIGIEYYTINEPKFATMKTLIRIDDKPSVANVMTEQNVIKAKQRKKKVKVKNDDLSFEVSEYDIANSLLTLELTNRSSTPLQSINLELYVDPETPLKIKSITGGFHPTITNIGFAIPFLKASMDSKVYVESFTLQLEKEKISSDIIINYSYEDTGSQDTKSGSDEIPIEI